MRIDPVLRMLRSDPAPQHRAQRAVEQARDAWKAREDVALMHEELQAFGKGAHLSNCPMLDCLVNEPERARAFIDALIDEMSEVLLNEPLGQVPFRHQYSGGISVLQLAESGRAALSLVQYEELTEDRLENAPSVCFAGGERYECYLAGVAEAEVIEIIEDRGDHAVLDRRTVVLRNGETLPLIGERITKLVRKVGGRLVMLRLSRSAPNPEPAREFRLSDGRVIHRASGHRDESRQEMAMALLGRMGRHDAAETLEEFAFSGSDHLRWSAVRECLALDTARGFAALCAIAADPTDTLSEMAGTLRARLIEAHPQLGTI